MKGYRTLAFNIAFAVLATLEAADWASIVPPEHVGLVVLGVTIVNVVLRTVTTTPVGKR